MRGMGKGTCKRLSKQIAGANYDEALALARFRFAETMRFTSDRPRLDPDVGRFLADHWRDRQSRVPPEMVRRLLDQGWLAPTSPHSVTESGLKLMYALIEALNAKAASR